MPPAAMTISYSQLLERVGHYLFGTRSSFSSDQTSDIDDCIRDGLNRVYSVYDWSYFRPVVDISTTAPYTTGTVTISSGVVTLSGGTFPSWAADGMLKVGDNYYSIAIRDDDNLTLTLEDLTVTAAAGTSYELPRLEIPLPAAFEAISQDTDLTYYPSDSQCYPAVRQRHDQQIRKWQQTDPQYDRPLFYSVRTAEFDPTVGSRKVLAFYPSPDAIYVLRVPMLLRPVMLDATNPYPIGGEQLGQLILEACLAAAEHNFEEREHVHEKRFMELLPVAVQKDRDRICPSSLGRDGSSSGQYVDSHRLREMRIGPVYWDGVEL